MLQAKQEAPQLTPRDALALQRSAGNRAVGQVLGTRTSPSALASGKGRSAGQDDRAVQRSEQPLQRLVSDADRQWASRTNTSIEQVQDAVSAARERLTADAQDAATALEAVQAGYVAFETKYDTAASQFTRGVRTAQLDEQQRRDGLAAAASLALFVAVGPWFTAQTATLQALRLVNDVKGYVDALGAVGQVATAVPGGASAPQGPSQVQPGRPSEIQWSSAMGTAIQTLRSTLEQNSALNGIGQRCINHVRFLGRVRDGTYAGEAPQSTRDGQAAQAMAENAATITQRLAAITQGAVSGPAVTFQNQAIPPLQRKTIPQLEQEMALRWISSLSDDQLDEIDTADSYLASIGMIDSAGNRLNFDTGTVTTDVDERLIRMLARTETTAMGLVGTNAEWLGAWSPSLGGGQRVVGRIRDSRNGEWTAVAPAGTPTQGGGTVQIASYTIDRDARSGWDSYGRSEQEGMRAEVTFRVTPVGPMGGGATTPGPVLTQG